ncbi:MAG: hypothetical protein JXA77_04940 [Bacteroidales bacterium]|nr:hypothetical protein [Bacteroidales bacterium]MBN2820393.1 hypothetical protein [Bacteroidales bacterium]
MWFVENNGVVSIEASNCTHISNIEVIQLTTVPNLGRTYSSLIVENNEG